MGISIQKAMGYVGVAAGREGQVRQRINASTTVAEIVKAAIGDDTELRDRMMFDYPWGRREGSPLKYPEQAYEVVKFCAFPDEQLGPFLFLTPLMRNGWYRYGNTIDDEEARIADPDNPTQDRCVTFDRPLYPYLGWMTPEGKEVKSDLPLFMVKEQHPELIPFVPPFVRIMASYVGIDWKTLRPGIATWWS